ncbi:transporter substrate-binding domain-containing protein [Camelliibacillus cellulosilyticus]|uniref:Transporter substrate-binding domain-containing protein n=1 Tax=Camelliibacillus cellulosilyticus TaxID=2174486 RepID=A0ABV9GQ72_9BACL
MMDKAVPLPSRLDRILAKGMIRVGTTGDYRPYTYYDKKTGGYEGLDIDMARQLASDLGVAVQFVETTWPTLMKDLLNDRFDIAMGGISRNIERQKVAHLTQGYVIDGKTLLIRNIYRDRIKSLEDADQEWVKIGVNPGGTNEAFVRSHIRRAQVNVIQNNLSIPNMVAEGKVDAMITDGVEAIYYANQDDRLYAALTDRPLTRHQKGYLIQRGDPDYANWLALWMDEMHFQGVFEKYKRKHLGDVLTTISPLHLVNAVDTVDNFRA